MKTRTPAYLLWLVGILGICGLHRAYLGRGGTAILWLLTFGLFGVGQLADLLSLGRMVDERNQLGPASLAVQSVQNVLVQVAVPPTPARETPRSPSEVTRARCRYCSALAKPTATTCGECGAAI